MEYVEAWTLDGHEEIEKVITAIENNTSKFADFDDDGVDSLLMLLSSIKMSRCMRIVEALDEINPGMANKIIARAEVRADFAKAAHLFNVRNNIFDRFRTAPLVMSEARMQFIADEVQDHD